MFTSFPKLFDKNFVIGFLLPVILAEFALAWAFPRLPVLSLLHSLQAKEDDLAKVTYLALFSYGAAILLMLTNMIQYRLLEGYLMPYKLERRLTARQARRRQAIERELALITLRGKLPGGRIRAWESDRYDELSLALAARFPAKGVALLPTRFGNAIRTFEAYPLTVYGADGVPMWLRLASVIPKDFADQLDDARAQANCLVSFVFVAAAVALAGLAGAVFETDWAALWATVADPCLPSLRMSPPLIAGLLALGLLWPAYEFAVDRAAAWGDTVKAAFDCYLPALIKQLGYEPPATEADRRSFWEDIYKRVNYLEPIKDGRWTYADAKAQAPGQSFAQRLRALLGR